MKPIGKTEAIKIYIMKDDNYKSGVMYKIFPPFSCKKKFEKEYDDEIAYATNDKELTEVINTITEWKLSKR
jgi:hypothetical protein